MISRRWPIFLLFAGCMALESCLLAGDGEGVDSEGRLNGDIDPLAQGGADIVLPGAAVSLGRQVQGEIFNPICTQCHVGSSAPQGMSLEASRVLAIIDRESMEAPGMKIIFPGDPEQSYLVWKIEGRAGISGGRMPFGQPALSPDKIALIRNWISAMQ